MPRKRYPRFIGPPLSHKLARAIGRYRGWAAAIRNGLALRSCIKPWEACSRLQRSVWRGPANPHRNCTAQILPECLRSGSNFKASVEGRSKLFAWSGRLLVPGSIAQRRRAMAADVRFGSVADLVVTSALGLLGASCGHPRTPFQESGAGFPNARLVLSANSTIQASTTTARALSLKENEFLVGTSASLALSRHDSALMQRYAASNWDV